MRRAGSTKESPAGTMAKGTTAQKARGLHRNAHLVGELALRFDRLGTLLLGGVRIRLRPWTYANGNLAIVALEAQTMGTLTEITTNRGINMHLNPGVFAMPVHGSMREMRQDFLGRMVRHGWIDACEMRTVVDNEAVEFWRFIVGSTTLDDALHEFEKWFKLNGGRTPKSFALLKAVEERNDQTKCELAREVVTYLEGLRRKRPEYLLSVLIDCLQKEV